MAVTVAEKRQPDVEMVRVSIVHYRAKPLELSGYGRLWVTHQSDNLIVGCQIMFPSTVLSQKCHSSRQQYNHM